MMMRVDKTRTNDLIGRIDHLDCIRGINILSELRDLSIFDKYIGLGGHNVIIRIVYEDNSIFDKSTASHDV